MSIHKRIKDRRKALGFTSHKAFAEAVGVSWQTVQQWEKEGGTAPNRSRIDKVAQVLETTPEWLLQGVGSSLRMSAEQQAAAWRKAYPPELATEKVDNTQLDRLNADEARLVRAYRDLEKDKKRQRLLVAQSEALVGQFRKEQSSRGDDQGEGRD